MLDKRYFPYFPVFEAPNTTKPGQEGTGIGLWRVRRICEWIGARYGFESEGENKGAIFWVDLKATIQL